jgi:mono/diheme cytochrome c family protein
MTFRFSVSLVALFISVGSLSSAEQPITRAEEVFANRVLALLKAKCFACHGDDPGEVRGEFNMLTRAALLKGGESGEVAILPGQPAKSPLLKAVKWDGIEMPPKENDRLTPQQIDWISEWIAGGAPWPDDQRLAEIVRTTKSKWQTGVTVRTSGGLAAEWTNRSYQPENLWAWQPLWKDAGRLKSDGRNPIDVLIDEQLVDQDLTVAPAVDRRTLIRRVTFDLIGLPPSPEEVAAFISDKASHDWKRSSIAYLHHPTMANNGDDTGWMSFAMRIPRGTPTTTNAAMPGGIATTSCDPSTATSLMTSSSVSRSRATKLTARIQRC